MNEVLPDDDRLKQFSLSSLGGLDARCWLWKRDTHPAPQNNWLAIVMHFVVHDWVVPVTLNQSTHAMAIRAPNNI